MQNSEEQKAVLKVNADGEVVSCPKGAAEKCGWKAGDKVCGKCGAMAIMTKAVDEDEEDDTDVEDILEDEEDMEEDMDAKAVDEDMDDEEDMEDEMDGKADVDVDVADDPEDDDEEIVIPDEDEEEEKAADSDDDSSEMEQMAEDDEEDMEEMMRRKKMRQRRLAAMGYKDAKDEKAFLCGQERKVMPGGAKPCEGCTGGCFPVGSAPDLLTVEELALDVHGGKILDSGYSSEHDKFVVDIRRKDGRVIEAYFDGDGTEEGWHVIPEEMITVDDDMIAGDEAILVALGQVAGKALDLGVQMIDGQPAYVVEVDGDDGFSYDVFVSLEGKALYADQWEYETADASEGVQAKADDSAEVKSDDADLTVSLMEFEALYTEEELKDQGIY